jgi:hypothetical protein
MDHLTVAAISSADRRDAAGSGCYPADSAHRLLTVPGNAGFQAPGRKGKRCPDLLIPPRSGRQPLGDSFARHREGCLFGVVRRGPSRQTYPLRNSRSVGQTAGRAFKSGGFHDSRQEPPKPNPAGAYEPPAIRRRHQTSRPRSDLGNCRHDPRRSRRGIPTRTQPSGPLPTRSDEVGRTHTRSRRQGDTEGGVYHEKLMIS